MCSGQAARSHKIAKVASSNSPHRESQQGPDERRGEISVRTPLTVQPYWGRSKHKGGEAPSVGRPEACMGCTCWEEPCVGQLVVAAIEHDFMVAA